jgi:site-specific recombinase XerD
VQDWLGHRHIFSTTIYAQITNQRREALRGNALHTRDR